MSSSSLIFSMGAISMKVNPASVSILIIATSLAIHLSTYIQPLHWLWGCSELGSYRGPHTFSLGVFARRHAAVWNGAPIAALTPSLRRLRPLSWGGRILLQLGCFKVAPKFSTTMCTMGEITATDYIERESCGILLAILHLDFYVWSFCAFLLDSSTYTNSLWCLRLSS
jgi:hypothetical protein